MDALAFTLASIIYVSTPLVFAVVGETLTERAGVVNLSLDGSMLLAALVGFAAAYVSGQVLVGLLAGMAVGALVALIVGFAGLTLKLNQVTVGFVLTLLCADLSSFSGGAFVRKAGPAVAHWPIPGL